MNFIVSLIKHLGVGIALIVLASAILLITDPKKHQVGDASKPRPRVAVVNYTSIPILEEGEAGWTAGMAESGFVNGRDVEFVRYNAEGDRPTAILIAKEVAGRDFDLISTFSTPTLQAMATANQTSKIPHVFSLVADPWLAGVGLNKADPSQNPDYMTGYGTLQPVKEVFHLARIANPSLKKVGVAWNPAETNSEVTTIIAREICKELGIELVEVTVDSSSAIVDAARALVSRGVEAVWVGGDTTVSMGLDTLVSTTQSAKIPVFTNMPGDVKKGSLFSLGADYYEVGRTSGILSAKILKGAKPTDFVIENFIPEQLGINEVALKSFPGWKFGSDWRTRAKVKVDETGVHEEKRQAVVLRPQEGRTYRVSILYFAPNPASDSAIAGLQRRLNELGFIEGKNVQYELQHAQGDMALIPAILQKLDQSNCDLIVSLTTPCLQAACTMVKQKPVVFTEVYAPILAGAGTSPTDHLPHITGVSSFPPVAQMFDTMQEVVPGLKTVGVVYNNGEANSRKAIELARDICKKRGLKLEESPVSNSSEILQAAQALSQRGVQVLWELGDNTVTQGLEALIKGGLDAKIPVVNSDAESAERGSLLGVGISFSQSGYAAGDLAAQVLLGESPAKIPFKEVAEIQLAANLETARKLNYEFNPALLKKCEQFYGVRARENRPLKVAFVQLVEGPAIDDATEGVFAGLAHAGLKTDQDITVKRYNAQGDLAQLPQIFQTIEGGTFDLIITSTTPAMISAARSTKKTPIVFTVASNPPDVDVFPPGQEQPNLVGVYDDPPLGQLLELAEKRLGKIKTVGTIWNPAEPNSEISVKRLRAACEKKGYKLVERHASAANELRDITAAICLAGIDLLVVSADNVTSSGFPAIITVAKNQKIPIFCTEPDLVRKGADAAIGVNFSDWGKQSARLAALILAGVPVEQLRSEKVNSIHSLTREEVAQ
ncbi:MAG TPA: ABC transporter substrate-binding protein [Planctomicrobium sp.]|nr:ABC transporter substrate-binding protein [Planctomicrobium sp.]